MQECKGTCVRLKYKVVSAEALARGEPWYNLKKNRVYCTTCREFLVVSREQAWHGNKCPCCHNHLRVSPRHRRDKSKNHKEWFGDKPIVQKQKQ